MYSQYLQETVAPILAKGIAECIDVQPHDPIEYLGLWMLHQQQLESLREKRRKRLEEADMAVDEWMQTKGKLLEKAVDRIQSVIRDYVKRKREEKAREQQQTLVMESVWNELKNNVKPKDVEKDGKEQEEILAERERLMQENLFEASRQFVLKLDKERISNMKRAFRPPPCIPRILKASLLVLGVNPKDMQNWTGTKEKIGTPTTFLKKLVAYTPEEELGKTARFKRVANILHKWDVETVKAQSTVAFLLHQWLSSVIAFRNAYIQLKKAKKVEIEEIEDPDASLFLEDDEKDPPKPQEEEKPAENNQENTDEKKEENGDDE